MIDSSDALGAGSYPEPDDDSQEIEGSITIRFTIHDTFPRNWDREQIIDYINQNLGEYTGEFDEVIEVDI